MRQPVPFGKYLLLDRISVGGMAEVFKAKSYGVEGFEKIIAIKRILPTMGEDRDFIKMFIDEAKIAGQLAHANICQIFELGRIDGAHFIAMEYIWGKDLLQIQNRLRKNKVQMPIAMACFCIAKVLEGLDYAHRKRDPLGRPLEIVHRDCSPQNVLVSYEGEVKVIDFGIAKATSRNSRTMAGVLKGKFGYMSPEQVRGLPLDRRSDIFAIGTMLFECLTGERLFQGETDFSTLEKVRNVDIQSPRAINPAIPESIERIILKALAKDVDDRYQWCSEMLADLQQFLMSQDVVFTAKTLSGWLKEQFAPEIERERGLLEQYKKLGRDGLIAGVPSAEAKLDVNEHLGEAGKPEGDSTMLGGPDFADMEHGVGAAPDVNQSPAAGGPRGAAPKKPAPTPAKAAAAPPPPADDEGEDEDEDGDFGEEAPTEIFGDDPVPAAAAAPPPAQRPSAQSSAADLQKPLGKMPAKTPTAGQPAPGGLSTGNSGPIGRPSTQRPAAEPTSPIANQPMAARSPTGAVSSMNEGLAAGGAQGYQQPYGAPSGQGPASPVPFSLPPGLDQPTGDGPQRTVLGVQAPLLAQLQAAGYRPSGQQAAVPAPPGSTPLGSGAFGGNYPPAQPPQQQPNPSYPSFNQSFGQQPQQPQGASPYPGYQGSGQMAVPPVDVQTLPVGEGKRSTLARDIGIGVGIAALVLIGFLVVKLFVLDKGDKSTTAASAKLATVKLSMPKDMTAELFVDNNRIGTFATEQTVGVTPGTKHVKLVGNNGLTCDDDKVKLEAGKTTTLECGFNAAGSAATGSAAGSAAVTTPTATGSAAPVETAGSAQATTTTTGTGSAATTTPTTPTAGAGSGSAAVKTTDKTTDKTADKTTDKTTDKTADKTTDKTADKTTDKTADKTTDKTADKTGASNKTIKTTTNTTKTSGTGTGGSTKTSGGDDKGADPTKGYLQVSSKPPAKILVDGNETGLKTPITGHSLPLAPGKHKITFVIGDDRFSYPVMIKAGATEVMNKDLQ